MLPRLVSARTCASIKFLPFVVAFSLCRLAIGAQSTPPPGAVFPNVLYGVAYYNEYMPADLQPGRLDKDVALMKEAGLSVVRMGESTWSLWEPSDGHFDYAWMDRVVRPSGRRVASAAGRLLALQAPDRSSALCCR